MLQALSLATLAASAAACGWSTGFHAADPTWSYTQGCRTWPAGQGAVEAISPSNLGFNSSVANGGVIIRMSGAECASNCGGCKGGTAEMIGPLTSFGTYSMIARSGGWGWG